MKEIVDIAYYPIGEYDWEELREFYKIYVETTGHKLVLIPNDIKIETDLKISELEELKKQIEDILIQKNK